MSNRLLQINFKYSTSREELDALALSRSEAISAMPGLQWKIWLVNEDENECGGHYLFEDEASMDNYLNSPLIEALKNNPDISGVSMKKFSTMSPVTAITRGPV